MSDLSFIEVYVRNPFKLDTNLLSDNTGLSCPESDRMTQDQFAQEADINYIVRSFGLTGMMPQNVHVPLQGDFTDAVDYQSSLNAIIAAEEAFMAMPADVRTRFKNDPQMFLEFCHDERNREEAEKLGLVIARADKSPGRSPADLTAQPDKKA